MKTLVPLVNYTRHGQSTMQLAERENPRSVPRHFTSQGASPNSKYEISKLEPLLEINDGSKTNTYSKMPLYNKQIGRFGL